MLSELPAWQPKPALMRQPKALANYLKYKTRVAHQ